MKLSVGLKVTNSLSLTPQLQQAIRLLQLSSLELEQEIQLQLDSNPLLEKEEGQLETENLSVVELIEDQPKDLIDELNTQTLPDDLPLDSQWDDIYIHQATSLGAADYEEREDNRQGHLSLKEHVTEQINLLNFSAIDRLIAYCIVDALDDKGFLALDLVEINNSVQQLITSWNDDYEVEDDEVAVVLKRIQQLDPVGWLHVI